MLRNSYVWNSLQHIMNRKVENASNLRPPACLMALFHIYSALRLPLGINLYHMGFRV